jgi:peptidoglycan/LPS O-acetylase OafA/YrhL
VSEVTLHTPNGQVGRHPEPEQRFRVPHLPALDGLRGVAILMVMAFHAGLPFVAGGFLGVDVFFVLSGFLITSLLIEEWERTQSVNLTNFYARRALRLLPALALVLGTAIAMPSVFGIRGRPWGEVLFVLFYMANWFLSRDVGSLGTLTPSWSLSIEEQFYLLWPPLLLFLLRRRMDRRWVVGAVALGVIAVWLDCVVLFVVFNTRSPRLYYGTDTRADGLLLGCLVGLLAAWGMLPTSAQIRGWIRQVGLAALGALVFLGHRAEIEMEGALGWSVPASLATAILLGALLTSPPGLHTWILEQKTLTSIGQISYGLYLWHVPVFHGFLRTDRMARLGVSGTRLHLGRFAAAFAVAAASFVVVERPMLKLKNRFRGGKTSAVTTESRHASRSFPDAALVIVVRRNDTALYEDLEWSFAGVPSVKVIVDRRTDDRRSAQDPISDDRRRVSTRRIRQGRTLGGYTVVRFTPQESRQV